MLIFREKDGDYLTLVYDIFYLNTNYFEVYTKYYYDLLIYDWLKYFIW